MCVQHLKCYSIQRLAKTTPENCRHKHTLPPSRRVSAGCDGEHLCGCSSRPFGDCCSRPYCISNAAEEPVLKTYSRDFQGTVLFIGLIRKLTPFWQCEICNLHVTIRLSAPHIRMNWGYFYIKLHSLRIEKIEETPCLQRWFTKMRQSRINLFPLHYRMK